MEAAITFANSRAAEHPLEYGHWYIDGGSPDALAGAKLSRISWKELEPARASILARIRRVVDSGHGGPEEVQTLMSMTTPRELGFAGDERDEALARFQVSVLTQGSGTQVFSTTFVQWAARETLRRAQPCTLLMRYLPRQRQRAMNELIAGTGDDNAVDPAGSLVDADMGPFTPGSTCKGSRERTELRVSFGVSRTSRRLRSDPACRNRHPLQVSRL